MVRYLSALILFAALPIHAAQYFVDYQTGNDGNAGTLSTIPWKHCIGDPNATGIPAVLTLGSGDTVNFKSGSYYVGSWILGSSGTAGAKITFDGQGYGTGDRCFITTSNLNNSAAGYRGLTDNGAKRDHLIIKNFYFKDIGGFADSDPVWSGAPGSLTSAVTRGGSGINLEGGGDYITVENCKFEEMGTWQNSTVMVGEGSLSGFGVRLENNSFVTVNGCEFTKINFPISIKVQGSGQAIDNITVTNCDIHTYVHWGVDIAPRSSGTVISNIVVTATRIYDYAQYDDGNWLGTGGNPHTDGIFIRTAALQATWTNSNTAIAGVLVDRCKFWVDDDGDSAGGTASVYCSQGSSATIRNSIFMESSKVNQVDVGYWAGNPEQLVLVYNNTFFTSRRCAQISSTAINAHVRFANNVFYRRTATQNFNGCNFYRDSSNFTSDYNAFASFYASAPDWYVVYDGGYRKLAAWQGTYGFDTHSTVTKAPDWFSVTNGVSSTWNVAPTATATQLIGTGTNLSAYFTHDYNGNTRTNWDIGAISFGSAPPPTPPIPGGPGSLKITNGRITSFTSIP